ncbi:MAG: sulfite oxidase-like oxidoreductase [Dehalococcoidia bacterium]|nr:sulfite oxidase-like oxidoreductase [Dehalococcoidia bacterium]
MKPFKKSTQSNIKAPRPEIAERVPPGQAVTDKFPVLTHGDIPSFNPKTWDFKLSGAVEKPVTLTYEKFMSLPKVQVTADFHCVTQWSRLNNVWEGVSISEVMKLITLKPEAKYVMMHADEGYTTNLPLKVLLDNDVLFAYKHDGKDLEPAHGWPLRLVVPKRYAWKSAKWVRGLEFMDQDYPGFWEVNGYHNDGDPFKEQRFS